MFKFEKKITKNFFINFIHVGFMKYSKLDTIRKDYKGCEMCDKAFEKDEMTNLAYVTNTENLLICDKCKDHALANGAEETTYNKK